MRAALPLLLLLACRPLPPDDTGPLDTSDTADTADTADSGDADHDGWRVPDDCDDGDPYVYPGAPEICDGKDSDCAGGPAFGEGDVDADGLLDCLRCDEAGFWEATKELESASAIQTTLDTLTTGLSCSYSATTNWMFLRLDNHLGQVECVYTGRTTTVTTDKPDPNTDMNTEHTWPQSEGADTVPAKCDLHHLYPVDVTANSKRASYPFGIVTSGVTWSVGGSKLGKDASGQTVFEPRDVHKGNVARSMLYFAQAYDMSLSGAQVALFQDWADLDPVDQTEWDRTMAIADQQAYANPFVACPDLVERAY